MFSYHCAYSKPRVHRTSENTVQRQIRTHSQNQRNSREYGILTVLSMYSCRLRNICFFIFYVLEVYHNGALQGDMTKELQYPFCQR